MAFLALEKIRERFPANDQLGHSRSCSLNRENPGRAIETRRDRRNRSWANLALKKNCHNARSLQENNARSVANQSARTIVAI